MKCNDVRELMPQALYKELDSTTREAFDRHLASCSACTREYAGMQEALAMMNRRVRTEPAEQEWNTYWDRLSPHLSEEVPAAGSRDNDRFRPASLPAWAYGVAAMLLIAIGIYAGRIFFGSPSPEGEVAPRQPGAALTAPSGAAPDSVTRATLAYLERSRNLLIGLANLGEGDEPSIDLNARQLISRQLVDQGNVLAVALNKPDQQRTRKLIEDLQVILMQLANIELKPGVPVVELVKKGIDEKSILLKINLEAMRAAEHPPEAKPPHTSSSDRL